MNKIKVFRPAKTETIVIYAPKPDPPTALMYPRAAKFSSVWRKPVFGFSCGQLQSTGPAKIEKAMRLPPNEYAIRNITYGYSGSSKLPD